jgi:CBS domain-containing protein
MAASVILSRMQTPDRMQLTILTGAKAMWVEKILERKGRDVATVAGTRSLEEVCRMLAERRIGALPVAEGTMLVGIVSERDIVRALSVHGAAALGLSVSSVMTRKVQTITRETSVEQAMALMTEGHFRHLPVVEEGKLVGIVSIGDIVKARLDTQQREVDDLRSYVAGSALP